jgi:hypothetical protein
MKAGPPTRAAVMDVLARLADVYVTRDAAALATVFAADPDVVMFSPGAAPVVGLADIMAKAVSDWTRSDAASLDFRSTSISAAGSVAWAATDADFKVLAGGQQTTTPVRITFVLERRGDEWLIVHAHYSLAPTRPAADEPPSNAPRVTVVRA